MSIGRGRHQEQEGACTLTNSPETISVFKDIKMWAKHLCKASTEKKIHPSIQYNSSPYSTTVLHLSYVIRIHYKYNQHCSISHQCNASHFQLTARLANGWHGANALWLVVMETRGEQGRSSNNQRTEEMSAQIWRKQTSALLHCIAQVLSDNLAFWFSPFKHQHQSASVS